MLFVLNEKFHCQRKRRQQAGITGAAIWHQHPMTSTYHNPAPIRKMKTRDDSAGNVYCCECRDPVVGGCLRCDICSYRVCMRCHDSAEGRISTHASEFEGAETAPDHDLLDSSELEME